MRFLHGEIKGLSGNMACLKARRQICRLFLYKRQVRDYRLACKKYSLKERMVYAAVSDRRTAAEYPEASV